MTAETRRRNLEAMAAGTLDVLVIGGGITGAGIAMEAAIRGLRVGLIDKGDFASGTSGRSSREIHGGLRYLARGQVGLVRESLRERQRVASLVPHLIDPLPFFVPVLHTGEMLMIGAALRGYEVLDRQNDIVPGRRRVDPDEACRMTGGLMRGTSGYLFYETVTDDARLTLQVILFASALGAYVANYVTVEGFVGSGRVEGVAAVDRLTGQKTEMRARAVINATGAWAAELLSLAGSDLIRLRPSKGVHLVFDRSRLPVRSGLVVPSVSPGAFQFMIPWGDRVYVGTTDTPYEGDYSNPQVDLEDIRIILESVNRALPLDLGEGDVVASWAGIRPLLDSRRSPTRDISRRHLVAVSPPGLVTVTGGKLTTFWLMAEDGIKAAMSTAGIWAVPRGRVARIGLHGSLDAAVADARSSAKAIGLDPAVGERMVRRYGDGWRMVLRLIEEDASLGERLHTLLPPLRVEAVVARRFEMAMCDDDILDRRTRITAMDSRLARSLSRSLPGSSGESRPGER